MTYFLSVLLLAASLVIHEMGHWMLLARYRVPLQEYGLGLGPKLAQLGRFSIRLFPLGAYLLPQPAAYLATSPWRKVWVSLGGPLASMIYAGLFYLAGHLLHTGKAQHALEMLATFNFLLGAFNLLPIPPLDGWNALEALHDATHHPMPGWVKRAARGLGSGLIYGGGTWLMVKIMRGDI